MANVFIILVLDQKYAGHDTPRISTIGFRM